MDWEEIERQLDGLEPATGGFTMAKRGLLRLADGRTVFVKIGTNDNTRHWAGREIKAYAFLEAQGYKRAPRFLVAKPDNAAFAIEALTEAEGWTWRDEWTAERVARTLDAMDELLDLDVARIPVEMRDPLMTQAQDGWVKLARWPEQRRALSAKLDRSGTTVGSIQAQADRSAKFVPRNEDLVHLDVRADNCAWRAGHGQVGLVDWNWLHVGDRRIDVAATLTMVSCSGYDVLADFSGRLDADALHWVAGYWLDAASRPIWPGGPEVLRDVQLRAGLAALALSQSLR